ncbi:hypothetical protein A2Y83_00375 [Candidatus Falkowbacteria bacterium RBG_13_39_14]|uniref:Uncharacterized protein n=1 Tax=Candidatus Falkowbacteria bacterium RBG_13_39_14 TaxID=1797985 RepID=A0A1F5S7J1_9BACT|nr:MAG: hypothetical protein A2Y83_00375 [Candidatus Falkowbacteria bacterium RBG_13_39_14]
MILLKYPSKKATTLAPIYFKLKFWAYKIVISLALKKAKKIIVPSEYVKNDIIKYFKIKTDKIEVIYEGVAKLDKLDSFGENKFIPLRECEAEKKKKLESACLRWQGNRRACRQAGKLGIGHYILYVGNAYPHKNLERLLRAFSMMIKNDEPRGFAKGKTEIRNWKFPPKADPPLAEEIGNLKLVLVGVKNDFYERLEKYAEENFLDLTGKIIFFGYATDRELAEFYKNAALYVFPSLEEGFGLPPLEAMSYGIPVISSKSSCLPEILGDAALYFNAEDIKDMAEKILQGLEDEKLREDLVKKGYERIKMYDWKKNARRTTEIYVRN